MDEIINTLSKTPSDINEHKNNKKLQKHNMQSLSKFLFVK